MNSKNLLTFGIFSIIFGLYSTEYAPSVSDEIREQNEQQNQYQLRKPTESEQQNQEDYDDINEIQQQHHQTKVSFDESALIMSSSLNQNKTVFETKTVESIKQKFSSPIISSTLSSVSSTLEMFHPKSDKISEKIRVENNDSFENVNIATTPVNHSKTRKFRGKRKKIKKKFNNKNKLKFNQEENFGSIYSTSDIIDFDNSNYNKNINYNSNRFSIKMHPLQLLLKDENSNPNSSIELLSASASLPSSSSFSSERKFSDAKNKLRKFYRNKHQRRKFLKNNKGYLQRRRIGDRNHYHHKHHYNIDNSETNSNNSNTNSSNANYSNNSRNKFTTIRTISLEQYHNNNNKNDEEIDGSENDFTFQHHHNHHHQNHKHKQHNQHHHDHHKHHHNKQHQSNNNPKETNTFNHITLNKLDDIDEIAEDDDEMIEDDIDHNEFYHRKFNRNVKDVINIDIDANVDKNNDNYYDDGYNSNDNDDDIDYNTEIADKTNSMQINRNFENRDNQYQHFYHNNKNDISQNSKRKDQKLLQRKRKKFQSRLEREKQQSYNNQKSINGFNDEYAKLLKGTKLFTLFNKTVENKNHNEEKSQQEQQQQSHQHRNWVNERQFKQQENFKQIKFPEDNFIQLSSKPSSSLRKSDSEKNPNPKYDDIYENDSLDNFGDDDSVNTEIEFEADDDGLVKLTGDSNAEINKYSLKNQKQQRLKQQQQRQDQERREQKSIEDINESIISTLNHYSIHSQEEQLGMMMEKSNQNQQNKITTSASPSSEQNSNTIQHQYRLNGNNEEQQQKYIDQSVRYNRFTHNEINTNNNKNLENVGNDSDRNHNIEKNKNDDNNNLIDKKDSSVDSTSSSTNDDGLNQEDFINTQHSVEKLMEITSIEKNIDENETGDLSCFQGNDFQPAPQIPHADIKYLRNEEDGIEKAFLEVEYICHQGYDLQTTSNNDEQYFSEKQRNIFCKNNNWIGTPPFCVKIENKLSETIIKDDGVQRKQREKYDRNQMKTNKTCSHPEKCNHLCYIENGIEKCSCHRGFQLNNNYCEDINECLLRNGHGPCQDICINTWGSYKCSCDNIQGSHLNTDGHTCMEIDECSQNNGGCSHTCIHTMGRAYCLCPEGYTLDKDWKTCVDIDECAEQASDDSSELRCEFGCINTPGSYTCLVDFGAEQSIFEETLTECADGFYHNSSTADCEDINECAEKNGGCIHRCINTFGSFYCSCLPGYHIDSDMKSCVAPLTLNIKNSTNGIDVSCPPLFPPKHGYLECSRPLTEIDEIMESNGYREIFITNSNNSRSIISTNSSNENGNIKNNINVLIAGKSGNNVSNIEKINDIQQKHQQQQQQEQQQPHLTTNHPGSQCVLRCPTGFRINGNFSKQCDSKGKWIGDDDGTCIRYPTPKLICPSDITLETPPNERMAKLKIPRPRTDVNFERDVSILPKFLKTSSDIAFEIGVRNVTYTARNPVSKLSVSCSFTISVVEGESPTVKFCPGTQKYSLEKQHDSIKVNWKDPIFQDNINVTEISKTNTPGNNFGIGSHQIVYIAKDEAGYSARCIFKVIVNVPPEDVLIHPLPFYRMFYKK